MDNMDVRYDKFEKDTLDGFKQDRARMDSIVVQPHLLQIK